MIANRLTELQLEKLGFLATKDAQRLFYGVMNDKYYQTMRLYLKAVWMNYPPGCTCEMVPELYICEDNTIDIDPDTIFTMGAEVSTDNITVYYGVYDPALGYVDAQDIIDNVPLPGGPTEITADNTNFVLTMPALEGYQYLAFPQGSVPSEFLDGFGIDNKPLFTEYLGKTIGGDLYDVYVYEVITAAVESNLTMDYGV